MEGIISTTTIMLHYPYRHNHTGAWKWMEVMISFEEIGST